METRTDREDRSSYLSPVRKHSIKLAGSKTSICLENQFWDGLCEIARNEKTSVTKLIERIDTARAGNNLSSSARIFVLNYFKALSQILSSKATTDLRRRTF